MRPHTPFVFLAGLLAYLSTGMMSTSTAHLTYAILQCLLVFWVINPFLESKQDSNEQQTASDTTISESDSGSTSTSTSTSGCTSTSTTTEPLADIGNHANDIVEYAEAVVVELRLISKDAMWRRRQGQPEALERLCMAMMRTAIDLKLRFSPNTIFSRGDRIFLAFIRNEFPYAAHVVHLPSVVASHATAYFGHHVAQCNVPLDGQVGIERTIFIADMTVFSEEADCATYLLERAKEAKIEFARRTARVVTKRKVIRAYSLGTEAHGALGEVEDNISAQATIGFFVKSAPWHENFRVDGKAHTVTRTTPAVYALPYPISDYDLVKPDGVADFQAWAFAKAVKTPGAIDVAAQQHITESCAHKRPVVVF